MWKSNYKLEFWEIQSGGKSEARLAIEELMKRKAIDGKEEWKLKKEKQEKKTKKEKIWDLKVGVHDMSEISGTELGKYDTNP